MAWIAASVRTRVVSWKDAADSHDSVASEASGDEDLLEDDELAAELGVDGVEAPVEGFGTSFAEELEELAQEIETSDEPD